MIVIVANRWDQTARAYAKRWEADDARVLTAQDLSTTGWRQRAGRLNGGIAVVEGKLVPYEEITGILTRLHCVTDGELVSIVPGDRPYVAAEMTSFLLFWLSSLKCPVLNRPTPMCLSGPHWRREKWVRIAAQAGIPVQPFHRRSALGSSPVEETGPAPTILTVAGKSVIGEAHPELHFHAKHLARLAGVELLAVHFSNPEKDARFVTADTFPDLSGDKAADAVLDYLRSGPAYRT
jgi:hypothetical protein